MKKKLEFEQMVETSVTAFLALGFMAVALLTVIYFATGDKYAVKEIAKKFKGLDETKMEN